MTQEEKQILLKDLCARLPFGIVCRVKIERDFEKPYETDVILSQHNISYVFDLGYEWIWCKPYLRPMSSMTEEEKKYISERCGFSIVGPIGDKCELIMPVIAADWLIDFYNEHHFDYRGLIPLELAREAKEGMYKTE